MICGIFTFDNVGSDWTEIVIEDSTIIEKVKTGMKVELFNNPTDGTAPVNLLENAVISNVYYWEGQTGTVYGENEWHIQFHVPQPQITTSIEELWVKFSNPKVLNFDYDSKNISTKVVNMHTIKPIDKAAILKACDSKLIVSIEEHNIVGGLGSAIAECKALLSKSPKQLFIGVQDRYSKGGSYKFLLEKNRLTSEKIVEDIFEEFNK